GGNGDLKNSFDPQVLQFFYTRYERQQLGWLDSISTTFSFNRQRDNRQTQAGNPLSTITFESTRTDSFGYAFQATTHIGSHQLLTFGGELYDEYIGAHRTQLNPVTNQFGGVIRSRFPNGARYQTYGTYIQQSADILPARLSINVGARYSAFFFKTFASKNPLDSRGRAVVPDISFRTDDVTFNVGASLLINRNFNLIGTISRGFRAPNVSDLGAVGVSSNGFEISTDEAAALDAEIGSTSDANAQPIGKKVSTLKPENIISYEGGMKYQNNRAFATVTMFYANLSDFITKRTLLLPPGFVGQSIGGEKVIFQDPVTGAVRVSVSPQSVLTRTNASDFCFYGIETATRINLLSSLTLEGNFFYLYGKDSKPIIAKNLQPGVITGRKAFNAPDIEGGLPPATGFLSLRYQPAKRHYWVEVYSNLASKQDRYSSIELADQRLGAMRSRSSIASFFSNGARARGLIGNGRDGQPNTADDILLVTGETLLQVQDRVLGQGIISAPFFTKTPGYGTFNIRGGFLLGEHSNLTIVWENIFDKNYRLHGSAIDAAGTNLVIYYSWNF
ncbi:MAG: TonB-dependent receptor, partial [Acidobacteriota bacterium]